MFKKKWNFWFHFTIWYHRSSSTRADGVKGSGAKKPNKSLSVKTGSEEQGATHICKGLSSSWESPQKQKPVVGKFR